MFQQLWKAFHAATAAGALETMHLMQAFQSFAAQGEMQGMARDASALGTKFHSPWSESAIES